MENKTLAVSLIAIALIVGLVVGFLVGKRKAKAASTTSQQPAQAKAEPVKQATVEKPVAEDKNAAAIKTA